MFLLMEVACQEQQHDYNVATAVANVVTAVAKAFVTSSITHSIFVHFKV
jgi:hypothetical protein